MDEKSPDIPEYLIKMIEDGSEIDDIFLDKEGTWFHNGIEIRHKKIIRLFNESVNITDDGTHVIHYSRYTYPINIEDTAVFVTGVRYEGFGPFEKVFINLSTGKQEELDIETLYYRNNNALYCRVMNGTMVAKFKRSPSFHILERLDENNGIYYVSLCGKRIQLKQEN